MAKVQIFLDKDETQHDAEQMLFKAINHHSSGEAHTESFQDPAMSDVADRMDLLYKQIHQDMIQEISDALDQDYLRSHGN